MIINNDILRRDTIQLLKQIEAQISEVHEEARRMGIPPEKMRDANGNWVMSPLLLAKAQTYGMLVLLQIKQ
jgi:hypothetical protein